MRITATIVSVMAAASLVSAGTFHPQKIDPRDIDSTGYIIEYQPNVSHNQVQISLKAHNIDFKIRTHYNILHGAAITVKSGHKGDELSRLPVVKNVWPITLHRIPKLQKSNKQINDPEVTSPHSMTGVDIVHKKYKLTGRGIKIGIIDTGIDYKHPSFAAPGAKEGCFARYGKDCRIKYGWDFVGDDYTGRNEPKPSSDPRDCQGHGSHVAGIIGSSPLTSKTVPKPPQPFVGVAPEATLGAYRVFGCDGSSGDDIILAAMELAFNDGMDIINLSLGGGSAYKNNPIAILGDRLAARGMALAAAAGNDGTEGVWMVADAGLGDLSSCVASFDNTHGLYDSVSYGGVAHPYFPSESYGQRIKLPASASLVPIFEEDGSLSDGCDPAVYETINVKDKVVLAFGDFSRCNSGARASNAQTAGAVGILIQTTPFGLVAVGGIPNFPMGSVENKAGNNMVTVWKKDPKTSLVWSKKPSNFLIEGGGAPSDFSSFGLDGELRSKPDLAAPGGNILSALPLGQDAYGVFSGTSMATPYIAGAHALYMQAKGSRPRGDRIRQVLKNTATIATNYGSKIKASAAKQGAGLVNVLNAITTTTSISPDHIDLLDSTHFKRTVEIRVKNEGKHTETYSLSHIPAEALNSYPDKNTFPFSNPIIEADYATVKFSADKVKIPAGKTAKITLTFKEPKKGDAFSFPLYSGFVVATPKSKGGVAVHVPYTGIKGDIAKVPTLDTDNGFPMLLSVKSNGQLTPITPEYQFNLAMDEWPAVITRLGSHTPDLSIRIFDAESNKFVGYAHTLNRGAAFGWQGRDPNHFSNGSLFFSIWVWDGKVYKTRNPSEIPEAIPKGFYQIVVAAQHKLSKGDYPKDFDLFEVGRHQIYWEGQQK